MSDSPNNNNGSNSNTTSTPNWLGFSLNSHMKMENPHHHHHTHQDVGQPSFFISSPYGEHDAFHTPLCVMPLKSDGSLCIMEALSRSQKPEGKINHMFTHCSIYTFLSNTFLNIKYNSLFILF